MIRKLSLILAGIAGILLLLELLFRILPVSTSTETGYYTDPLILTYPAHHRWTTSTGWDLRNFQNIEANNFGYVANRDFKQNAQAVALIGDSFVEASMLNTQDRPGAQLEKSLGGRPVFAMGNPGTALLDYAERIRFAHDQFGVRDFVVMMERGDVKQSLCGSGNINGPCLDPKTLSPKTELNPSPDVVKKIIRHSSLAQYVFGQLKFNPGKLGQRLFPQFKSDKASYIPLSGATTVKNQAVDPVVEVVAAAFFKRIQPYVKGKLVIVVDSDRTALLKGKVVADLSRSRFIELARAAGAIVVDTEPLFISHFAQSPLALAVGPYDGHLNALGVQIVTSAAAEALMNP